MKTESFSTPQRVALINRYPLVRTGLRVLLKDCFGDMEFLEANDVSAFLNLYKKNIPDLIFIGLGQFSDDDNTCFLVQLKKSYPKAKVIVNDFLPSVSRMSQYLEIKISGYLTFEANEYDLRQCIANVVKGKVYIDNQGINLLLNSVPVPVSNIIRSKRFKTRERERTRAINNL